MLKPSASGPSAAPLLARLAPLVFVVLWASGFVVARLVRTYAEPESFVTVRFACSAGVLALIALASGASWPRTWSGWRDSLIAGALMQGLYVGCTFWAIKHGLSAAVASLVSGLQPLLTGALAGPLLDERVSPRRWRGIFVGLCGAVLVLVPNLRGAGAVAPAAILSCFAGMVAITLGTIWQKRIGGAIDLRSGATIQFLGGLAVVGPLALGTEHFAIANTRDVWLGLAWSVLVLSVTAALMLLTLIRQGAVARVTSLFYLVPPFTALMALGLFGEGLVPIQFVGMGVAAVGVAVANRG